MTSAAVNAMNAAPRCGALTRKGTVCAAPAVGRRGRCRMHSGGGKGGAPKGSQNALRHGFYSKRFKTMRKGLKLMIEIMRMSARQ